MAPFTPEEHLDPPTVYTERHHPTHKHLSLYTRRAATDYTQGGGRAHTPDACRADPALGSWVHHARFRRRVSEHNGQIVAGIVGPYTTPSPDVPRDGNEGHEKVVVLNGRELWEPFSQLQPPV